MTTEETSRDLTTIESLDFELVCRVVEMPSEGDTAWIPETSECGAPATWLSVCQVCGFTGPWCDLHRAMALKKGVTVCGPCRSKASPWQLLAWLPIVGGR